MSKNQLNAKHCYCGSRRPFSDCCALLIDRSQIAESPEMLMRSRFSAYANGNYQYLAETYAKQSQVGNDIATIKNSAESCHWIALVIHNTTKLEIAIANQCGYVEFSAFYIYQDSLYEMRENSRFSQEPITEETSNTPCTQWRYLDGDIIKNTMLNRLKRNQVCPCNHYPTSWNSHHNKIKKYKHCCGK